MRLSILVLHIYYWKGLELFIYGTQHLPSSGDRVKHLKKSNRPHVLLGVYSPDSSMRLSLSNFLQIFSASLTGKWLKKMRTCPTAPYKKDMT